ncbi:hypothetical protein HDZ31DRAFT_44535 [Schizophyllum fasciatum]
MTESPAMKALEAKFGYYIPTYHTIAPGVLEDERGNVVLSAAHPAVQEYLRRAREDLQLPRNYDARVMALAALEVFGHPKDPAHWLLWGRREAPIMGRLLDKLILKAKHQTIYSRQGWNGADSRLFTLSTQRHPDWITTLREEMPWFDQLVAPGEAWWAKEKKIRSGASRPTTRSATRPTRRVTRAKAAEDAAAVATTTRADDEPPRKRTRATAAQAKAGPSTPNTTPIAPPRTRQRARQPAASSSDRNASTPELSRTISSESTPTLATPPSAPAMSSPRIISRPTQPGADSRDISPGSVTTAVEVIPMDPKGKGKAAPASAAEAKQSKGRAAPRVIATPTPTSTRPLRAKTQTAKAAVLGKRKADADSELAAPQPRRKTAKRA